MLHLFKSYKILQKIIFYSYIAFTLNGFVNQERNLTFVKTDFQVLKF